MGLVTPSPEEFSQATPEELAALTAACLKELDPGRQKVNVFTELARIMTLSTAELAPLRPTMSSAEVMLIQRPPDDRWWAGKWHLPGRVILPVTNAREGEITGYNTIADGLLADETSGNVSRVSDAIVFDAQIRSGLRGTEQTVMLLSEVEEVTTPQDGAVYGFFDAQKVIANPPDGGLIIGHDQTIQNAMRRYMAMR